MHGQEHFERDDILGNWYPTDCVIALISADDAQKTMTALQQAGFDRRHRQAGSDDRHRGARFGHEQEAVGAETDRRERFELQTARLWRFDERGRNGDRSRREGRKGQKVKESGFHGGR